MHLILDISNNNPEPVWKQAKGWGVEAVMLKVSEGAGFVDKTFATRRHNATVAGLPVGFYHFARPDQTGPVTQAQLFCKTIGKIGVRELRPALDLEVTSKHGSSQLIAWARSFNQEVVRLLGVGPLFYTYGAYASALRADKPIGYGLWLAAYGRDDGKDYPYQVPAPWRKAVAHQFTSTAHVAGCTGPVDLSHAASMNPLYAYPVRRAVTAPLAYLGRH